MGSERNSTRLAHSLHFASAFTARPVTASISLFFSVLFFILFMSPLPHTHASFHSLCSSYDDVARDCRSRSYQLFPTLHDIAFASHRFFPPSSFFSTSFRSTRKKNKFCFFLQLQILFFDRIK